MKQGHDVVGAVDIPVEHGDGHVHKYEARDIYDNEHFHPLGSYHNGITHAHHVINVTTDDVLYPGAVTIYYGPAVVRRDR